MVCSSLQSYRLHKGVLPLLFFCLHSESDHCSRNITKFILYTGPGRFSNLVNDDELDLGTGDDLPQLWNSAGLDRTNDVFLCEEGDGGLQDVLSFRVDSDALRESCSEQDVDSQRPPTGYTIIRRPDTTPELRGYSFILRWPRASPCTCSCTDCSDCSSIESTAVFITGKRQYLSYR